MPSLCCIRFSVKKCHLAPSFKKIERTGVADRTINATSQFAYVSAPSISSDTVQYFRGGIVAQSAFKRIASTWWQKITTAADITPQNEWIYTFSHHRRRDEIHPYHNLQLFHCLFWTRRRTRTLKICRNFPEVWQKALFECAASELIITMTVEFECFISV